MSITKQYVRERVSSTCDNCGSHIVRFKSGMINSNYRCNNCGVFR